MSEIANPPVLMFQAHAGMPTRVYGWIGSWPPPQSLTLVLGKQSARLVVIEPDDLSEEGKQALAELRENGNVVEYVYARESFSGLPPDIDDLQDAHVVRAASYVHVGTTGYSRA